MLSLWLLRFPFTVYILFLDLMGVVTETNSSQGNGIADTSSNQRGGIADLSREGLMCSSVEPLVVANVEF